MQRLIVENKMDTYNNTVLIILGTLILAGVGGAWVTYFLDDRVDRG